jgi:hypothetical protein
MAWSRRGEEGEEMDSRQPMATAKRFRSTEQFSSGAGCKTAAPRKP